MAGYSNITIQIIGAFLILILGLILESTVTNILKKFLRGIEVNRIVQEQLKIRILVEGYLVLAVKYSIYFVTLTLILMQVGVSSRILILILIIFLVLVSIFIILAFKDWIPNLISHFYLKQTDKIKVGDVISVKGVKGKVIGINMLETKIETDNKEIIFIPNSNLTKYEVIKEK